MHGLLKRISDHEANRLTLMADPVVLKHVQPLADVRINGAFVRRISELRRVAMRQHRKNAFCLFSRCSLDGGYAAVCDRASYDSAMRHSRYVEFCGIRG